MIRDFVLSLLLSAALLAALIAGLTEERTYLDLTAQPLVSIAPARVHLRAIIQGPMTEKFYCPRVEWIWPDETRSSEESDCVPFEEGHTDAQRVWSRDIILPSGEWPIKVELSKNKKVFASQSITVGVN